MNPYKDTQKKGYFVREFSQSSPDYEFVWHRDKSDRKIIAEEGDEWFIQMDNQMPQVIELNKPFYIKEGVYHRILKGKGNLKLKIWENNNGKI